MGRMGSAARSILPLGQAGAGRGWGGWGDVLPCPPPQQAEFFTFLPKVAQAGSLSPWKPLSIVKVQKI